MFCPSCSHKNVDEAKFCAKCGAPLRVPPAPPPAPPAQPAPPAPPVPPPGTAAVSGGMKWGITVGSVLFPLLGIVMGIIYMRDANPDKKAVGKLWLGVGIVLMLLYVILQDY